VQNREVGVDAFPPADGDAAERLRDDWVGSKTQPARPVARLALERLWLLTARADVRDEAG
jgi:hypothetical protein